MVENYKKTKFIIDKTVLKFLNKNQDLVQENSLKSWRLLYKRVNRLDWSTTGKLTRAFQAVGIEPATIMREIPSLYLSCSHISSYTIPQGITSIEFGAFSNCSRLTDVVIPEGVASIGEYAFADCKRLNTVHITDIAAWCNIEFGDYSSNPLCYAHKLYLNGELVTELEIPSTVTKIKNYAFFNCDSITSIELLSSVVNIGNSGFKYCGSLTRINFRGTKEQWALISKGDRWKPTTNFTVYCTDGEISDRFA